MLIAPSAAPLGIHRDSIAFLEPTLSRLGAPVNPEAYLRATELIGTVETVPCLSQLTVTVPAFASIACTRPISPVLFLRTWPRERCRPFLPLPLWLCLRLRGPRLAGYAKRLRLLLGRFIQGDDMGSSALRAGVENPGFCHLFKCRSGGRQLSMNW